MELDILHKFNYIRTDKTTANATTLSVGYEYRLNILDVMTPDQRITRLSMDVRLHFKDVFHSLIELEHTIRDYLHQIDAHNRKVKRIRKLKHLKINSLGRRPLQYARCLNP